MAHLIDEWNENEDNESALHRSHLTLNLVLEEVKNCFETNPDSVANRRTRLEDELILLSRDRKAIYDNLIDLQTIFISEREPGLEDTLIGLIGTKLGPINANITLLASEYPDLLDLAP